MPRLSELVKQPDMTRYERTEPLASLKGNNMPIDDPMLPVFNVRLRCPMPAIGTVNPDSLRQFYRPGMNQMRVLTGK